VGPVAVFAWVLAFAGLLRRMVRFRPGERTI